MLGIEWILLFLLLGCFVGFMAGLLGIGGGGIMVPVLTSMFLLQGVPVENVVHLALGTSMASIITTSISSLRAHHLKAAVIWPIVRSMTPGIVVGTFVATIFFSMFMAYVAIQMCINKMPKAGRNLSSNTELLIAGSGIGAISAIVSIGGGSLTVPYLIRLNVDIKKAIGTSAAIGLPISIAGTLGYVINGWETYSMGSYTFGYVYFPAVLLISATSFFTAPFGAKLAHKLNISTLKKIFAVLLIILSIKMLISVV
jgi:uncharacterized membrane protein YfcA